MNLERQTVALFLALLGLAFTEASAGEYTAELIPPTEAEGFVFDVIAPFQLNDRGVVVGVAASFETIDQRLFHYRKGATTDISVVEDFPRPHSLNRAGVVVLTEGRRLAKIRTPNGAVRPLEGGLSDDELSSLHFGAAGRKGRVAAYDDRPYLYSKRQGGWSLISSAHPIFDRTPLIPAAVNRRGQVLLLTLADQGRGVDGAFLYDLDGEVDLVPAAQGDIFTEIALNDAGTVAGTRLRSDGLNRAYYYQNGDFIEIVPEGRTRSTFHELLQDGRTLVGVDRGREAFVYTPETGITPLWTTSETFQFGLESGCSKPEKAHLGRLSMNERGDVVGLLGCVGARGPFHFRAGEGFTFLRPALESLPLKIRRPEPVDLNEKGQILVNFWGGEDPDPKNGGALLTPIN